MKDFFKQINGYLNYSFKFNEEISISIKAVLILILILIITSFLLKNLKRIAVRKLQQNDKNKFDTIFSFGSWLIYIVIFLSTLHSSGVNVTAIFAASAALLIGVGLALQTFFQDIISGIFIIVDQSVHVGDVIELDGRVGRVEEIRLRTTRVITIEDKIWVIPNHLYLTRSLYNWTQNGATTRENISIRVAYGSDVELVESLLLQAVKSNSSVLETPEPVVLLTDFAESSLMFELIFTTNDCFWLKIRKSEIRFEIERLFREHNIRIPFPQRDVYIKTNPNSYQEEK